MIRGYVSRHLAPMIPASIRKEDGGCQRLELLLDTGFYGDLTLTHDTVHRYGLAIGFDHSRLTSNRFLQGPETVELFLEEASRTVSAQIRKELLFPGLLGTALLLRRRITVDVVENGAVNIDWIPSPSFYDRILQKLYTPKRQRSSQENPPSWAVMNALPWINLSVRDSRGRCHTFGANVDTGNNGELSFPPTLVDELGLRLSGTCQRYLDGGLVVVPCGEVEVTWQGRQFPVQFIQQPEDDRPIVGMELFRGHRITIDVDFAGPPVRISRR